MNLYALEMPDDPTALGPWLERQVVGMHLAELVAELSAFYPSTGESPSLDEVLGNTRAVALSQGLSEVPINRLGQLMRHPQLLFDLQDLVLAEGGPNWLAMPVEDEHQALVEKQRLALRQEIFTKPLPMPKERGTSTQAKRFPIRRIALALGALAAILLVAVFLWPRTPSADWGWGRSGALAANVRAPQYLNLLADEANQWFDIKPTTPVALQRRLREMRYGCDVLQRDPLKPLAEADRTWLLGKCRDWAVKFDEQIASLQNGAPIDEVKEKADATVRKLIGALKDRATKVS